MNAGSAPAMYLSELSTAIKVEPADEPEGLNLNDLLPAAASDAVVLPAERHGVGIGAGSSTFRLLDPPVQTPTISDRVTTSHYL